MEMLLTDNDGFSFFLGDVGFCFDRLDSRLRSLVRAGLGGSFGRRLYRRELGGNQCQVGT